MVVIIVQKVHLDQMAQRDAQAFEGLEARKEHQGCPEEMEIPDRQEKWARQDRLVCFNLLQSKAS